MKIGIIVDVWAFPSGVKTYVDNLVKNIVETQDEIYLIHSGKVKDISLPGAKEIVLPSFYKVSAPSTSLFNFHRPVLLRKYKFDIIHYTHNYFPLTFRASGSRNVCTMYGIAPLSHPQFHPFLSRYTSRVGAFLARKMDMILTDSEWAKTQIIKFCKVPSSRVRVIYFGLDEDFRPPNNKNEATRELELKLGIQPPFILQVNAYRPIKNAATLVRAFGKIKKMGIAHKLILVGKPTADFNKIAQLVKGLGLENEVMLMGYVSKDDLIKLYGTADLVVIPSFKESFCFPLLEALACGCPTIASNVTALPEIGGDAVEFFDPYNCEDLASKMYRVIATGELGAHLSRKGVERAKSFSWERCAQEHLAAYKEVSQIAD